MGDKEDGRQKEISIVKFIISNAGEIVEKSGVVECFAKLMN
jgi:hypothetical protein